MFIVLEGVDGSGKTTLAKNLYNYFIKIQKLCHLTREPGGSTIGEKVRDLLKYTKDPKTQFLLFAASRNEHIQKTIFPKLKKNIIVICDRFIDSSIVYQGFGQGLSLDFIEQTHSFILESCFPNITLYCKVSSKVAIERIQKRNNKFLFDNSSQEHIEKLINGYNSLYDIKKDNTYTINAHQSEEEMLSQALTHIKSYQNSL